MLSKQLSLRKLIGYELTLDQGEDLLFAHGTGIQAADVANVTIRTEGSAEVYYGTETTPGKVLSAGSTSLEGDFAKIAGYESFRLKATTPKFKYICLRDYKSRDLKPVVHRHVAGQAVMFPAAKNLFLAIGSVTLGGATLVAPTQILAENGCELTVAEDALIVSFDILPATATV